MQLCTCFRVFHRRSFWLLLQRIMAKLCLYISRNVKLKLRDMQTYNRRNALTTLELNRLHVIAFDSLEKFSCK